MNLSSAVCGSLSLIVELMVVTFGLAVVFMVPISLLAFFFIEFGTADIYELLPGAELDVDKQYELTASVYTDSLMRYWEFAGACAINSMYSFATIWWLCRDVAKWGGDSLKRFTLWCFMCGLLFSSWTIFTFWMLLQDPNSGSLGFGGFGVILVLATTCVKYCERLNQISGLSRLCILPIVVVIICILVIKILSPVYFELPFWAKLLVRLSLTGLKKLSLAVSVHFGTKLYENNIGKMSTKGLHILVVPVAFATSFTGSAYQVGGSTLLENVGMVCVAMLLQTVSVTGLRHGETPVEKAGRVFYYLSRCGCIKRAETKIEPDGSEEGGEALNGSDEPDPSNLTKRQAPATKTAPKAGSTHDSGGDNVCADSMVLDSKGQPLNARAHMFSLLMFDMLVAEDCAVVCVIGMFLAFRISLSKEATEMDTATLLTNGAVSLAFESVASDLLVLITLLTTPDETTFVGHDQALAVWRDRGWHFFLGWAFVVLGLAPQLAYHFATALCPAYEGASFFMKICEEDHSIYSVRG